MKELSRDEVKKFVRFGITGGMNTAVDFIVFTVLFKAIGLNVYAAQTVSYICGTLNSYIINRSWTFKSKDSFLGAQLVKFLVTSLITLGISILALNRLIMWFPGIDKLILKLPVIAVTLVINFFLNRLWVFNKKSV